MKRAFNRKEIFVIFIIICLLSVSFTLSFNSISKAEFNNFSIYKGAKQEFLYKVSNTGNASDGYILFGPMYSRKTYLLNYDGDIVHTWKSKHIQGLGSYLLENGNLLRSDFGGIFTIFWGDGFSGQVEMFDWNGSLIWEFKYVNRTVCIHNDIEPLPNGNVLMIVWERKTEDDKIEAGFNPNIYDNSDFR